MKKILSKFSLLLFTASFLSTSNLVAESERKVDLPRKGRLAGSTTAGAGQIGFASEWGDLNLEGGKQAPVSGSVTRLNEHEWNVQVFNNSEDQYRVQLQVVQTNQGKHIKSDNMSLSLKAGEQAARKIKAHSLASDAELNLNKWQKVVKQTSKNELEAQIQLKRAELEELEAKLASMSQDSQVGLLE